MAKKDMEKMKKLIKDKKDKQNEQSEQDKILPNMKTGSSKAGVSNMKTRGSNNKV